MIIFFSDFLLRYNTDGQTNNLKWLPRYDNEHPDNNTAAILLLSSNNYEQYQSDMSTTTRRYVKDITQDGHVVVTVNMDHWKELRNSRERKEFVKRKLMLLCEENDGAGEFDEYRLSY